MKRIAFFCIPAHGHTNPMLPVAAKLVGRGNTVRFYSFNEFKSKIEATGEETELKNVSITEMTIQGIRTTLAMDEFLHNEFLAFNPEVIYTDSICFWGKLNAWKHGVPIVVSTSTFAFNQMSSQYMKNSLKELADMIFGLPKISKELRKLKPYGYHVRSALSLVQSDNNTDSIVYTSRHFQPYAESFSKHYAFVDPLVFSKDEPEKEKPRPLVYISLGTVINNRPDFYSRCVEALKGQDVDIVISCGNVMDREALGILPENVQEYPYVDQLSILSRADVFITHCGMNSISESMYMATPPVLYLQISEQRAVARRSAEIGAGVMLNNDSVQDIRSAVQEVLNNTGYRTSAKECSVDFRFCIGATGAAEFIENAPHPFEGVDVLGEINKANGKFQFIYWLRIIIMIAFIGAFLSWKYVWIIQIVAKKTMSRVVNIFLKINTDYM